MISVALVIISIILSFTITIVPESLVVIEHILFGILILLIIIDFRNTKTLNLYQAWIAGFIFIIMAEIIQLSYQENLSRNYIEPIVLFLEANNLVLLGYLITKNKVRNRKKVYSVTGGKRAFSVAIIISIVFFIASSYQRVIANLTNGRQLSNVLGSTSLLGALTEGLGIILPAIIAYYYGYLNKNKILAFLFALPIFIIQFIFATRFKLLFAIIPFFIILDIVKIKELKLKKCLNLLIIAVILMGLSDFIKDNRNSAGFEKQDKTNVEKSEPFLLALSRKMSSEGCIEMGKLANDYYKTHDLEYGKESTFILYFWVPRSIWHTKPTPIDHWLIRKYKTVSDTHSTASGFIGELRADFGYFCLLFAFIIGFALRKLNNYVFSIFLYDGPNFNKVFVACLFPYVFFFVRSPIASTKTFVFEIVVYLIFKKLFFHKTPIISN